MYVMKKRYQSFYMDKCEIILGKQTPNVPDLRTPQVHVIDFCPLNDQLIIFRKNLG